VSTGAVRLVPRRPSAEEWQEVGERAITIIDGCFLRRPEIVDCWDYSIWFEIDFETMVERACRRDVAWVGSVEMVEERYRRHWIPTHELYEELVDPATRADIVIDNRNIEQPMLTRLRQP
jgi:uridine kinase